MANPICTWLASLTLKKIWNFFLYLIRYTVFFQMPLIWPMFQETFMLTEVAYVAQINDWPLTWSTSSGLLISMLMDSVSEVLGYFQATYLLGKEFNRATFLTNRFVAASITIFIATLTNLAHVNHEDDWINFIKESFIPFLCLFFVLCLILRNYRKKKTEIEAGIQLDTVWSGEDKDTLPVKNYQAFYSLEDAKEKTRRSQMKWHSFTINLVTMFVNGFVEGLTKDLQTTLKLDKTKDGNTTYVSYTSAISNFLVLGVGTLLGFSMDTPKPETFREQGLIIKARNAGSIVGFPIGFCLGCALSAWMLN